VLGKNHIYVDARGSRKFLESTIQKMLKHGNSKWFMVLAELFLTVFVDLLKPFFILVITANIFAHAPNKVFWWNFTVLNIFRQNLLFRFSFLDEFKMAS